MRNVELYFVKCDPQNPNARLNKENPTWEVQCRTSDPAQRDEWAAIGIRAKLMVHKENAKNEAGEDISGEPVLNENGKKQWKINLKKRSLDKKKQPAQPVKVVNGALDPIDPNSIGNGSIGNIKIFQYEYTKADGTNGLAPVLMEIQITKHIVYKRKPGESFDQETTETVMPDDDDDDDSQPASESPSTPSTPKATNVPKAPVNTADAHPEVAF